MNQKLKDAIRTVVVEQPTQAVVAFGRAVIKDNKDVVGPLKFFGIIFYWVFFLGVAMFFEWEIFSWFFFSVVFSLLWVAAIKVAQVYFKEEDQDIPW